MAWNEPGGDKDPWSGGGGDQGPPDLDEVVKKMQERLGGLFGGRKGSNGSGNGGDDDGMPSGPAVAGMGGMILLALIVFLAWQSFYIIEPAERGVVLRFGAFHDVTEPGPNLLIPLVDQVMPVDIGEVHTFTHTALMLTQDETIVDLTLTVQSKIQDPADYKFQDWNPGQTLEDATETALREVIGKNKLYVIITENRSGIADAVKERIQGLMDLYNTGMEVTTVNIQEASPPEQVKAAFDDANKAREDKRSFENQARAYANDIVPRARGAGARQIEDAKAYKEQVIAEAEGETSRFLAVLKEYRKAPEVTRKRLYLETVEEVLGKSNKVMLDVKSGNSLMYLPLDRLMQQSSEKQSATIKLVPQTVEKQEATSSERKVDRSRRTR